MSKQYYVTTWDTNRQAFTPQPGVRTGPWTKFGLRKALRGLRNMGYDVSHRKLGTSVLVESREPSRHRTGGNVGGRA